MTAPGPPAIGVVVVHYGTDELTLRCLRSLLEDRVSPPTHIVLVDNGPGEGVAARVRAELPAVEVVVPGTNTGFARGCNLGIAALRAAGAAELVALVNSDAVVRPGWLCPLVNALEADPVRGAAVPKVLLEGSSDAPTPVIANAGVDWRADGYGLDRGGLEVDDGRYDDAVDVTAWSGGAVLLRGDYLRDVGPFDERLFLYYEDLELGLRGAARGWHYRYEPASVVDHRQGASSAGDTGFAERLKERNRLLVLARHGSPWRFTRELARFVAITGSYLVRGDPPRGRIVVMRVRALAAAIVGLPGALVSRRRDGARRRGMPPLA